MDAFASPSTRGDGAGYRVLRALEGGVLALALALSLFSVPGRPDSNLDASWQQMLIYARAHGIPFGRGLIFTWGPWGFLCNGYHLGSTAAVPILLWQTLGQLLIACALVYLTRTLPLWRRLVFVALVMILHWLFLDVIYFVLISLIAIAGLMERKVPVFRILVWTLALGFLSQLKFTYFAIASVAVLAAAALWGVRLSWRRAAAIVLGYTFGVAASWVAAGQNLDNLYPYVRRSMDIAAGYADAMELDEPWGAFLWGSALALLCALFIWRIWRTVPDRAYALAVSLSLGFTLFVMWKESFTRADLVPLGGHILGLFTFVPIMAPAVTGLLFPARRWHWFDGAVLFCAVALAFIDRDYYRQGPRVAWERIYGSLHTLPKLGSLPSEWQASLEEARKAEALPAIREAVGGGTADAYDFNTGAVILNEMRLSSRPIFQSYSAYTPSLEGWNLRFYQSDKAPDYLLWSDERVDNRYPGQDDAPIIAGLAGHYEPLFQEAGYWLFRRTSPLSKAPLERRFLYRRKVLLSEEVVLPAERTQAVWLEADPVPTGLGRFRSAAYKPAIINIAVTDDLGVRSVWRMVPRISRAGFLLVPNLIQSGDVASLARGEASSWVRSFHFEAPAGQEEFWSHVDIGLFDLPGLKLRPVPPIPWLVQLGILDRPAVSVTSVATQQVIETPEGRALLLHASGEMMFAVPRGAKRISFGYGLREGAYTQGGHTAGVTFRVDLAYDSGNRVHLWSRLLDPVARSEDRGSQHIDLDLPQDGPSRLILRTEPGLKDDNRWDWSYLSHLHFLAPESH